jgi:predicted PurR-regulated permease PerM
MHLNNDKLKQSLLLIALFALGGFLFWLLQGFLSAFLAAVIFYILLRKPYFYFIQKWNKTVVILLLMVASFLVLVLPVLLVSLMLSSKINYLVHHYQDILNIAQELSAKAKNYLNVDLLSQDSVNKLTGLVATVFPHVVSATASALMDIFVLYFLLYFMLSNAKEMEAKARSFLPFKEENNRLLLHELQKQTVANSIGIAGLALIQCIISLTGYAIFGVDEPAFWAVLTGIASAIPVVGTGIVWIPMCVVLYASGHQHQAIYVAIYCAVVLAAIENVFRIVVLKKLGDIHPLITFFGVIIGIDLFGVVGIIFGPLLISYFILLLSIYSNEYSAD